MKNKCNLYCLLYFCTNAKVLEICSEIDETFSQGYRDIEDTILLDTGGLDTEDLEAELADLLSNDEPAHQSAVKGECVTLCYTPPSYCDVSVESSMRDAAFTHQIEVIGLFLAFSCMTYYMIFEPGSILRQWNSVSQDRTIYREILIRKPQTYLNLKF